MKFSVLCRVCTIVYRRYTFENNWLPWFDSEVKFIIMYEFRFLPLLWLDTNELYILNYSCNIDHYARELCNNNAAILSEEYLPELKIALKKLQKKLQTPIKNKFYHFKSLKTNILPLTNVAFNKDGSRYDSS